MRDMDPDGGKDREELYLGEAKPQLNILYGKGIIFNKQKD